MACLYSLIGPFVVLSPPVPSSVPGEMSISNEIINRDLESQTTNRTRAGPSSKVGFLDVVALIFSDSSSFLRYVDHTVKQSRSQPRLVSTHGILQALKDTLKNPTSHTARRREEYAMRMSKGASTSILVFVSIIFNQCAIACPTYS